MKKRIDYTVIVLILVLGITSCNSQKDTAKDQLSSWISDSSHKIETLELSEKQIDLAPLNGIIGNARMVCLGESRHDIREQFQLKQRFIKYLVEEMGFTTFILEASLPYAEQVNNYLQSGEGDINEIMANMPGWFLWDTEEILAIFKWMRSYNSDPENQKKLKFFGIDIVAPGYGLNSIFEYLKRIDNKAYKKFIAIDFAQASITDISWQSTFQEFSSLPPGDKETLRKNYSKLYQWILDNESLYAAQSGDEGYQWIKRLTYCAHEACRMFTAKSRLEMGLIRDSAMADNSLWIRGLGPGDKSIIWAHNVHITKGEFYMTGESESIKGMGYILGQELKDEIVSIGASFNRGEFVEWGRSFPPAEENSFDGILAKAGMSIGLLDLSNNTKSEEVRAWLNSEQVIMGQEFEMTFVPSNSFDAIFFIDRVSRTVPNPRSMERFRNMN